MNFLVSQFSCSVLSDSLQPHELQHARPLCPSPTPGACSSLCSSSRWCHPTISSSVIPFSFCLQSFPASGSFSMSQFFERGGQSIGVSVSASVLPVNIQDWYIKNKSQWQRICLPMQETQETQVQFLGWEDPLEEEIAAHSGILAWRLPRTKEPDRYSPCGHKESDMTEWLSMLTWTTVLK